jgi:DNA-binding IclR family transcriptional regulator
MPAANQEAVRPIRALLRGLEAMAVLSASRGLTVTETARRAKLPRTTTYRILETLRAGGYVVRDEHDRYLIASEAGHAIGKAANGATDHATAA